MNATHASTKTMLVALKAAIRAAMRAGAVTDEVYLHIKIAARYAPQRYAERANLLALTYLGIVMDRFYAKPKA